MRGIIRRLRKQRGLSQAQLAQMIGKGRSTVTMYEVGVNEVPMSVLYALARVLDVPITTFFTEDIPNGQEPDHEGTPLRAARLRKEEG